MAKIPAFNKHNFNIKDFTLGDIGLGIKGMFISPKETVATDGHSLIRVSSLSINKNKVADAGRIVPGNFIPFSIGKFDIEKILKLLPKKETTSLPHLNCLYVYYSNGKIVELGTCDHQTANLIKIKSEDGKYPRYQELKNQKGHYLEIEVNVKYLKRFIDFYAEFLKNKPDGLKIKIPKDPAKAIIFEADNDGQKVDGLLMPLGPKK